MANQHLNTTNVKTIYEPKVIAQVEQHSFWKKQIGESGDDNTLVFKSPERFKNGKTWRVPLRKAVTGTALEDGATYEGQGQKMVYSNIDVTANERGQVFGELSTFEELQTAIDMRDDMSKAAADWHVADFDSNMFSKLVLAHATLPEYDDRDDSTYNVHYCGNASSWDNIDLTSKLSAMEIAKARMYFESVRGLRPVRVGNFEGYILVLPPGACFDLGQNDPKFTEQLLHALPSSEDHVLFKGHGMEPWGYSDGVLIVKDSRPVYGGSDYTYLETEDAGAYQKFEGLFLGAQAVAFAEWEPMTWFERIYDHNRKVEISVKNTIGATKTTINLGTLNTSDDLRDYGAGYVIGGCQRPW